MTTIQTRTLFPLCVVTMAALFLLIGTPNVNAQTYEENTFLAPSDLGISKYSLSASPPKDKVMVFRQKKTVDGNDVDIFEAISFTSGKEKIETVLLFEPSAFPYVTPEIQKLPITIKTNNGGFSIPEGFTLKRWTCGGDGLIFHCQNNKGTRIIYSFTIEIQSLADAIKRIPELASNLSSKVSGWTYSVTIKPEQ